MEAEEARKRLRGPFIPMMTTFKSNFDLDLEGFRRTIRFLLRSGIKTGNGVLMAAVAAGEFPAMTVKERKAVAKTLVEEAYGKVPLIIAAQHTDPRRVIEICRYAEDLGIDAVQMAPTYYEHGQTDDDVLRFFKLVAKSTDIGFMIYNTYWHGYNLRIHMMPKLMKIKNVVSMKWCAPTEWQYREVLRFYGDKLAIMDNQNLHVWGYMHGAVGFLSHVGTFWPEHELLIWKLLQEKKYQEANSELLKLNYPFYDLIYEVAKSTGIVDTNLTKAAVEMVGLPAGPVRPPARNITESEKKTLRALFKKAEVPLNRTI
jgi:4-hydroxy-tetrahydrodipicolinate synthase